jgi:hypothetical protein
MDISVKRNSRFMSRRDSVDAELRSGEIISADEDIRLITLISEIISFNSLVFI